jgi:ABC-type transport system involved in cytochrome bd biosynthesis fused ATPase/permease subunit
VRTFTLVRPPRARLLLALLFGVLALGSGVALMATSAWLISRAAQHPPVLTLMVAIVAVRAFGIGRGVFRYAERLTSHDATFRVLADLRARVYERLERQGPVAQSPSVERVQVPPRKAGERAAGPSTGRRPSDTARQDRATVKPAAGPMRGGDLLGRLVADVDAVQDLYLRVLLPGATAAVVGGASVGLAWALLPSAGAILLAALLAAGLLAPWLSAVVARRAESRGAELRGELTAHVVDTLRGAPELIAYGAAPERLAEAARLDRAYTRTAARSSASAGAGAALATLAWRSGARWP